MPCRLTTPILLSAILLFGGPAQPAAAMDMISGLLGGGDEAAAGEGNLQPAIVEEEKVYVSIEQLMAPVIVGRRVNHNIMLTLSIAVPSQSARNRLIEVMPRLRDAMLRDLYSRPVVSEEDTGRIDIEGIKQRMLDVALQMAGPDIVVDVLVTRAIRTG